MNKEKKHYFKKIFLALMVVTLVLGLSPTKTFAAEEVKFSGGKGTKNEPWLISNVQDLVFLSTFINSEKALDYDNENAGIGNFNGYYFKQTSDIDLSKKAWEPIGYSGNFYFAGEYDGDNYTVSNIKCTGKVDKDGYATAGLFGWVAYGSVSNTHIRNSSFEAISQKRYSYSGGITGVVFASKILNCSVMNSSITSKRNNNNNCAGGIAGYSTGGAFQQCAAEDNLVKSTTYCGGLVGELDDDDDQYNAGVSSFLNCYVTNSSIIASTQDRSDVNVAGGFIGEVTASTLTLENCFVYNTTAKCAEESQSFSKLSGVFAGALWHSSSKIADMNCYYGQTQTNNNTSNAAEKSADEFKNGTVANALGSLFMTKGNFPTISSLPADYSKVKKAIASVPSQLHLYKDDTVENLKKVIDNIIYNSPNTKQLTVDGYVNDINKAISSLIYKDADYSYVDAAIAEIPTDLSLYTSASVEDLNNALKSIVRRKNILDQDLVNGYATAIKNAISHLQLKHPQSVPIISSGANQTITYGNDAIFKSNDEFENFIKILIDNNEVAKDKYKVEKGSIIITLKADYLKTLSEGNHSLTIVSLNGNAKTDFSIMKASHMNSDIIKTNDYTNIYAMTIICMISAGCFISLKYKTRKKSEI